MWKTRHWTGRGGALLTVRNETSRQRVAPFDRSWGLPVSDTCLRD